MHLNQIIESNSCGPYEILSIGKRKAVVRFVNTGYQVERELKSVSIGRVKDPFHPTVRGVGYIGNAKTKKDGKTLKSYSVWNSIISRCYSEKTQNKRGNSSYKHCLVDERWHSFENFKSWYDENYIDGWHIDKDLLSGGNVYGPETCVFLPHRINTILIDPRDSKYGLPKGVKRTPSGNKYISSCSSGDGATAHIGTYDNPGQAFAAYKTFKESLIKKVAGQYKGIIDNRVYEFLMKYEI